MNDFYQSKLIKASVNKKGHRIVTLTATFPRFLLSQFNTHGLLSRLSASSRAVPVARTLEILENSPFIPNSWPKNQKGMTSEENLSSNVSDKAKAVWLEALNGAKAASKSLMELGVHKEIANRLIEPFMPHTILITATEWANFIALRTHPHAQPEMQKIASLIRASLEPIFSEDLPPYVQKLEQDEWHMPFVNNNEAIPNSNNEACFVSAARCARVSYLRLDGNVDVEADLARGHMLEKEGHMSPFQHVAQVDLGRANRTQFNKNLRGWRSFRSLLPNEEDFSSKLGRPILVHSPLKT